MGRIVRSQPKRRRKYFLVGLAAIAFMLFGTYTSVQLRNDKWHILNYAPHSYASAPNFRNPKDCYASMWVYFKRHRSDFHGEAGSDALRDRLLALSSKFAATNKKPNGRWLMIDVGANIGQIIPFYRSFIEHSPSEVHLFEPNPLNFGRLKKDLGSIPDVVLHNAGVSVEPGQATFQLSWKNKEGDQFGRLGGAEGKLALGAKEYNVTINTLDEVFEEDMKREDTEFVFLKSDTEGFDYMVMAGGPKLLSHVRMYLFECHALMQASQGGPGSNHSQIAKYLTQFGFDVFKIAAKQFILFSGDFYYPIIDEPRFMHWHNCLAMRRTDPLYNEIYVNTLPACMVMKGPSKRAGKWLYS